MYYLPEIGERVRLLIPVYGNASRFRDVEIEECKLVKIPSGSEGIVEDYDIGFGITRVLVVRFDNDHWALLGPSAWELVNPVLDDDSV